VFFDNYLAKRRPELAINNQNGSLWRNRRGDYWVDPSSREVWEYNAEAAKKAILLGFKEIQFDYVRFPSDGSLKAIKFPFWNESEKSRAETIRSFFEYITNDLRAFKKDVVLSADIFAFTFLVEKDDDLGIGQTVDIALPYFDFISPMIYPSHYSAGNFGFGNPAEHPYEVVSGTLEQGKKFFGGVDPASLDMLKWQKIRPWLQDFNLGAFYGKEFLKKQKEAVYGQGLKSWLFWNPRNNYLKDKY
ncbi:MAG: putative glycoside hydrolase, partial [Patescibacteria group bacterium]